MTPMQTPETAAPEANAARRSHDLFQLGCLLVGSSWVALAIFVIASALKGNDFWSPAGLAISSSLIPPLFTLGLLLVILSFPVFAAFRIRPIAITTALLLLAGLWYPFWGHDTLLVYLHVQEQAFATAGQGYCALPVTDL